MSAKFKVNEVKWQLMVGTGNERKFSHLERKYVARLAKIKLCKGMRGSTTSQHEKIWRTINVN